jgi:glycosyltransferase A (GT-A) superfamily protein (DUF2064 family)
MQGDKAIVLLDDAARLRVSPENFGEALSSDDMHALYSGFLVDFLNQLAAFSTMSIFLYSEDYLGRNQLLTSISAKTEIRLHPGGLTAGSTIADSLFSEGYRKLVFLTCKNPLAPLREIQIAFQLLELEDDVVVVGPTEDGNWYLLAVKALHEKLLEKLSCDSTGSCEELLKAACELDVMTFVVQSKYDVVSRSAMYRLQNEIEARIGGHLPFPRKTRELLFTLEGKYNL